MIETTYVAVDEAAKALNVSEDNLLVAASEGCIQLHWLLNRRVWAKRTVDALSVQGESIVSILDWAPQNAYQMHFMYIPLSCGEAAEILKVGTVTAGADCLLASEGAPGIDLTPLIPGNIAEILKIGAGTAGADCLLASDDAPGIYWTPLTSGKIVKGGLTDQDLSVSRKELFVKRTDLDEIEAQKHMSLAQHNNHGLSSDPDQASSNARTELARRAANARHSKPGGSREKREAIRAIWASGKYSSRDLCAEQECAALEMSPSTARKALRNTPDRT
jgi:hypothetical protein